jgi:uncharacterized protein YehS (DUF1456 family)
VTREELLKYINKYAYDNVDQWSDHDLKEFAEGVIIERARQKLDADPEGMIQEMLVFWEIDSLDSISPDDFKC